MTRILSTVCTLLALAALIVALVLPPLALPQKAQTFLVTFDITQSMNVADVRVDGTPTARLVAAKAAMRDTLRQLPCGSRVAWAVFTDYRTIPLIEPLEVCAHFDALLAGLDFVDARMRWANASSVGKGLYWALRATQAVEEVTNEDGVITLFFSDGHEAPPEITHDPNDVLKMTKKMHGLVVGVGDALASPIPRTDAQGRVIAYWQADEVVQRTDVPAGASHEELSALNEAHLQRLARKHDLHYVRLGDASALRAAMRDAGPARVVQQPRDVRWVPLAAALALLVLPHLIDLARTRRRRLRAVLAV